MATKTKTREVETNETNETKDQTVDVNQLDSERKKILALIVAENRDGSGTIEGLQQRFADFGIHAEDIKDVKSKYSAARQWVRTSELTQRFGSMEAVPSGFKYEHRPVLTLTSTSGKRGRKGESPFGLLAELGVDFE